MKITRLDFVSRFYLHLQCYDSCSSYWLRVYTNIQIILIYHTKSFSTFIFQKQIKYTMTNYLNNKKSLFVDNRNY